MNKRSSLTPNNDHLWPPTPEAAFGRRALVAAVGALSLVGVGFGAYAASEAISNINEQPARIAVVDKRIGQLGTPAGTVWGLTKDYAQDAGVSHEDVVSDVMKMSPDLKDGAHPGDIAVVPATKAEIADHEAIYISPVDPEQP